MWRRAAQVPDNEDDCPIEPLNEIATTILLQDYEPKPVLLVYYSGWAAGDDHLYPID